MLGLAAPAAATGRSHELLTQGETRIDVVIDRPAAGGGPAIVMLPSSQRDSLDFDDVAARVAQAGFVVLRPQPRGMGRSSGPPPDMTLSTLAGDVALTIERLAGGARAVVVGHAYGHWVARVADMNHPRLVRGVVVLGASAKTFPPGMTEALAVASDPSQPEAQRIEALEKSMFAPGNDPRSWLDGWHPHLRDAYRRAGQVPAKDQWFGTTHAPILDLQGAQDPWRPANTRDELKHLLGDKVTVRVIAHASHALVPEQPAAVAREIVDWVRTLAP
ncbi:MAG TPA: alpha/beta hydrolase [Burkholderiaceae bacterium]|nr:alpha/beta hydrolase [Burkholderiaceae bacterium]